MANPKHVNDPWIRWHINLPMSIAVQVEARLLDPLTGSVRYGSRAKLVEKLLREWLAEPNADLTSREDGAILPVQDQE